MRSSFLHGDLQPYTFTSEQRATVCALARAREGTSLRDVMGALNLGRTAATALLTELMDEGLYGVPDRARRHLRYHLDHFDTDPQLIDPDLHPALLRALQGNPGTAAQVAGHLNLDEEVAHANLEHLRAAGRLLGPRTAGPRVYYAPTG